MCEAACGWLYVCALHFGECKPRKKGGPMQPKVTQCSLIILTGNHEKQLKTLKIYKKQTMIHIRDVNLKNVDARTYVVISLMFLFLEILYKADWEI